MFNIMGNILKNFSFTDFQTFKYCGPLFFDVVYSTRKKSMVDNLIHFHQIDSTKVFKTTELHVVPNVSLKIEDSIFSSK